MNTIEKAARNIDARLLKAADKSLHGFNVHARSDFRWWFMAALGAIFVYTDFTIPPEQNCAPGGECAPWLVYVARVVGIIALFGGLGQIIANPERGSRVDFTMRKLYWWEGRQASNTQSLSLDEVGRIEVILGDNDRIFFYDKDDKQMPSPCGEVIPWSQELWATALVSHFPHIRLDVAD